VGQLDFIDYHSYATGDSSNADSTIWDNAQHATASCTTGLQHEIDRANSGSISGELRAPPSLRTQLEAALRGNNGNDPELYTMLARDVASRLRQVLGKHRLGEQPLLTVDDLWRAAMHMDKEALVAAEAVDERETADPLTRRGRRNAAIRRKRVAAIKASGKLSPGSTTMVSSSSWSPLLLHDEINISWAPPDSRMDDSVGAVFDTLAVIDALQAGADSILRWNEADGWYGANAGGPNFERRPPSFAR